MQNYIGADVTSMVTLPVIIFEPMTMLQKMAEVCAIFTMQDCKWSLSWSLLCLVYKFLNYNRSFNLNNLIDFYFFFSTQLTLYSTGSFLDTHLKILSFLSILLMELHVFSDSTVTTVLREATVQT